MDLVVHKILTFHIRNVAFDQRSGDLQRGLFRTFLFLIVFAIHGAHLNAYSQNPEPDLRIENVAELKRQAYFGVAMSPPSLEQAGAEVKQILNRDVAERSGLKLNDRVLRINDVLLDSPAVMQKMLGSLREGDTARFEIVRDGQLQRLTMACSGLPLERLPGVKTVYASALTDGGFRVRTILTQPINSVGKLPVVFLVGWLSCDSVEYPFGPRDDGFGQLLHDIATKSGHALVRVEKPGVGDSEGPSCAETDFHTELSAYRAAFSELKSYGFLNLERVTILGLSNGGGIAPLVPQREMVRSYIVGGGWAKSWFEHMIDHERRRLTLEGMNPGKVTEAVKKYVDFYTDFLRRKISPRDILKTKPHLSESWYGGPDDLYGRPSSFFHQLEDLNLSSAWEQVNVPVLVMHGEFDWIMSRDEGEIISSIVNKRRSGLAKFVSLQKSDHLFMQFESAEKAFAGNAGKYNTFVTEQVLSFLRTNH